MSVLEIILVCIFAAMIVGAVAYIIYKEKKDKIKNLNLPKENRGLFNFFNRKTNYFTNFEKIWLFGLTAVAVILAIALPEDSVNGIDGRIITILYLADIVFAMLCELLITKQSKWNAVIYLLVETIEFSTLLMLKARIASIVIIVAFWVPMHVMTYANWNRHTDKEDKKLTVVRQLKWWQSLLLFVATAAWTAGIGYVVAAYGPETDFFTSDAIMKTVAYLDACFSILGVIDGILVWLRFKESIMVWTIATVIESVINIITGQWILLILKVGYLTNDLYGLFKWTKYIKTRGTEVGAKPAVEVEKKTE